MRRFAIILSVLSLLALVGCEQKKPPLTPDSENPLGDAGMDIPEAVPPPAPAPPAPVAPAPKK